MPAFVSMNNSQLLSQLLYSGVTATALPVFLAQLAYRRYSGEETSVSAGERLGYSTKKRPNGPLIWFHTASTSESAVALPVIFRCLLDYNENVHILLTTGSQDAFDLLSATLPSRVILQFAPSETPLAVWLFMRKWRPQIGIFMESELRPNLLEAASRCGVKLALLNAKLSSKTFLEWHTYHMSRQLMSRMVSHFSLVIPQSDLDVGRFRMMGATLQQMPGWCADLKFAAAMGASLWHMWRPSPEKITALKKGVSGRPLWVAANTHEKEEESLARVHIALKKEWHNLLTIIAPRQPARAPAVRRLLTSMGLTVALWSEEPRCYAVDVLVVDVANELPLLYSVSEIVFIGNSLHKDGSGHNLAEAAVAGCAVLIGEHTGHFSSMTEELNQAAVHAAEEAAAAVTNSGPMNDEMYEPFASSGPQPPSFSERNGGGPGNDGASTSRAGGEGGRSIGQQQQAPQVQPALSHQQQQQQQQQPQRHWRHCSVEAAMQLCMARPSTAPAAISYTPGNPRRCPTPPPSHSLAAPSWPTPPRLSSPRLVVRQDPPASNPNQSPQPGTPMYCEDLEPGSPVTRFRRRGAPLSMRLVQNLHYDEVASLHGESAAGTPNYPTPQVHTPTTTSCPPATTRTFSYSSGATNILYLSDSDPLTPSPHTFASPLNSPTGSSDIHHLFTIHPQPPSSHQSYPSNLLPHELSLAHEISLTTITPTTHRPSATNAHSSAPSNPPPSQIQPHISNLDHHLISWPQNGTDPPLNSSSTDSCCARLVGPPPDPQIRVLTTEPDPRKPPADSTEIKTFSTPTQTPEPPIVDPAPILPMVKTGNSNPRAPLNPAPLSPSPKSAPPSPTTTHAVPPQPDRSQPQSHACPLPSGVYPNAPPPSSHPPTCNDIPHDSNTNGIPANGHPPTGTSSSAANSHGGTRGHNAEGCTEGVPECSACEDPLNNKDLGTSLGSASAAAVSDAVAGPVAALATTQISAADDAVVLARSRMSESSVSTDNSFSMSGVPQMLVSEMSFGATFGAGAQESGSKEGTEGEERSGGRVFDGGVESQQLPGSSSSTPRFGQGTSYSSPTARWRRRRSRFGSSPAYSPSSPHTHPFNSDDTTPQPVTQDHSHPSANGQQQEQQQQQQQQRHHHHLPQGNGQGGGQGQAYSQQTAQGHHLHEHTEQRQGQAQRQRHVESHSHYQQPGQHGLAPSTPTVADAGSRTLPPSRLHRRSTANDGVGGAEGRELPAFAHHQHHAQSTLWTDSTDSLELHDPLPGVSLPPSTPTASFDPLPHPHRPHSLSTPRSPNVALSPSSSSGSHTPSWMATPMSMGASGEGAPSRPPWRANPSFTPHLPRHEELDLTPNTPDSPTLSSQHVFNARRAAARSEMQGVSYMRYAGEYILPATHLPCSPHGPAVWKVVGEAGLTEAVGQLLREPLERRSRGHAAAQAAAKLASGLVSTVWHFLDDLVVTPALHDYVKNQEQGQAMGAGVGVGGAARGTGTGTGTATGTGTGLVVES